MASPKTRCGPKRRPIQGSVPPAKSYIRTSAALARISQVSRGIAKIRSEGQVQASFGHAGLLKGEWSAVAVGSSGAITTLAGLQPRNESRGLGPTEVTRFAPGGLDRTFGRGGKRVVVPPGAPGASFGSATADPSGRRHLPVPIAPGAEGQIGEPFRNSMVLTGVDGAGKLDPEFGSRGFVAARFEDESVSNVSVFLDPEGRVFLVGTYGSGEAEGWRSRGTCFLD
jgi:hypothetical protein